MPHITHCQKQGMDVVPASLSTCCYTGSWSEPRCSPDTVTNRDIIKLL